MKVINIGYNHCHDVDFNIHRPFGSDDYLLLILKTPSIFNIDGKDMYVKQNSIFIYDKDIPQYYKSNGECFSNDWIHFLFENNELQHFLSLKIPFNNPIYLDNIVEFSMIVKLMAYENYSKNIYASEIIDNYFNILLFKLSQYINGSENLNNNEIYDMLSTIRTKIYNKPYEKRTVESTAHEVRMSKSNFQHLYKKFFGISLINDITQSRVQYSMYLLKNTDITIKNISDLCGYNNYAHFERQFKKIVGMTPSQYKSANITENIFKDTL